MKCTEDGCVMMYSAKRAMYPRCAAEQPTACANLLRSSRLEQTHAAHRLRLRAMRSKHSDVGSDASTMPLTLLHATSPRSTFLPSPTLHACDSTRAHPWRREYCCFSIRAYSRSGVSFSWLAHAYEHLLGLDLLVFMEQHEPAVCVRCTNTPPWMRTLFQATATGTCSPPFTSPIAFPCSPSGFGRSSTS